MQLRLSLLNRMLILLLASLMVYFLLDANHFASLIRAFSGGVTHRAALALALPVLVAGAMALDRRRR